MSKNRKRPQKAQHGLKNIVNYLLGKHGSINLRWFGAKDQKIEDKATNTEPSIIKKLRKL